MPKKFKLLTYTTISIVLLAFLTAALDSYIFKINKAFDIFGSVFRYIALNYVEDIDPDELIKYGIDGILSNLDPFTEYYTAGDTDDIDVLTTGSYTGLGISVGIRDGMLTIIGIRDGFSAAKSGVRIGDRLYKIDTAVVLYETTKGLRQYTKGQPGTFSECLFLRDGVSDTLRFRLERENIQIKNVTYSEFIEKNIAYVKLERFSRNSSNELKLALSQLQNKDSIHTIILDLRDNPGGLLESAISTCELFLPKGSVIVKTKGRRKSDEVTYRSFQEPYMPYQQLVVLINENSASASEIVAGAIQDLDRGIIVGRRSYGKGLVQSIFELPHKGTIKLTTSKYYTPSGRCIQKLDQLKKANRNGDFHINDSSVFYTLSGRKVFEYVGIIPDTIIAKKVYSGFINDLHNKNIFFNFANVYSSSKSKISKPFTINSTILKDFEKYLKEHNFEFQSNLSKQLQQVKSDIKKEKLSDKMFNQASNLEDILKKEEKDLIKINSNDISKIIEFEILNRFLSEKEMTQHSLNTDEMVKIAIQLISTEKYAKILASGIDEEIIKKH